jgi:predicted RNA-binding protein with PUA-like domain
LGNDPPHYEWDAEGAWVCEMARLQPRRRGATLRKRHPTAISIQSHPMNYLLKTEPTVYSFANLEREKSTIWDGVTNPAAVKHLREMKPGERLVIYHTGDEKSTVGTASVVSVDPSDPKTPLVKIKAGKSIAEPRTLAEIKSQKLFADSPLVRQGRLSVVPLSDAQYKWLTGE